MLLEGKSAIVTGSSRGLGRAYAVALAEAGAQVVINGRTNEQVDAVVQEIKGKEGNGFSWEKIETFVFWDMHRHPSKNSSMQPLSN